MNLFLGLVHGKCSTVAGQGAKKLGKQPGEFVRRKEAEFRENNLSDLLTNPEAMAAAIAKFPKIMERPIFVAGEQAAIGRPLENILSLIP